MSTRYKIKVAYDGTNYSGWQVQPHHRTVQGEIERLLREMSCEKRVRLESSGRTDAGVHARAQVAHFDLKNPVDPVYFKRGLNAQLDRDIRILTFEKVPDDFHARYSAVGKEYRYFIYNGLIVPPTKRFYRLQEGRPLDEGRMRAAAEMVTGEHAFAPFSANPKREVDGTVRNVNLLRVTRKGSEIVIRAQSNGFLYKMVRSLAGFLIRVVAGDVPVSEAERILCSKTRTARVPTAPPQGLFLWKVYY